MKISIIIPFFNEEGNLEKLFEHLIKLEEAAEILFVDGGSTDGGVRLLSSMIANFGKGDGSMRLLRSPVRSRAMQMNFGAEHASGEVLLFLHADSILPYTAAEDIERALRRSPAGCFKLRFDSRNPLMLCCGRLSGFRVISRGIMFGDQGIFITKELFEKMGGFAKLPLMEDYDFSIRLKRRGIKPTMAESAIITSARRFEQNGILRTMFKMQKLQHAFRRGEDIDKIAAAYRGRDR